MSSHNKKSYTRIVCLRNEDMNEAEFKLEFDSFLRQLHINFTNDEVWKTKGIDSTIFYDSNNQERPFYIQKLYNLIENVTQKFNQDLCVLDIDLGHIKKSNLKLFRHIIRYPADTIIYMDEMLSEIILKQCEHLNISPFSVKTGLIRHPFTRCMKELNPNHIETLVSLKGIVIRCSSIIPDMRRATFRCTSRNVPNQFHSTLCEYEETVYLSNGEVQEPLRCMRCNSKYSFELLTARCLFGNKQIIKLQETLDSVPEGETPQTVIACVYDNLVDVARPGDFVEVTGIYRAAGIRVSPKIRTLKSIFRTYVDVNTIQKDHCSRYSVTESELSGTDTTDSTDFLLSAEFVKKMRTLGSDPNIYEKLVKSFAPNIWECDDIKKGLLCQLFGGTPKYSSGRLMRSDIHILLCGDPSTAKSQLLHYVNNLAPRGVFTCGRGSSAVGLTAAVTRDVETREFVLESGAVVLSDRGICCIDEFDKMDDRARVVLHEVMEQQTVSIAKAGIVCSLNARTAILSSANPVHSRYDVRKSVVENINLPPSLMSRFGNMFGYT